MALKAGFSTFAYTFRWIDTALIVAGLVCMLNYLCKIYGLWAMGALMLSLVCSACRLRFIRNCPYERRWQKFRIDALMVMQFFLVLGSRFADSN